MVEPLKLNPAMNTHRKKKNSSMLSRKWAQLKNYIGNLCATSNKHCFWGGQCWTVQRSKMLPIHFLPLDLINWQIVQATQSHLHELHAFVCKINVIWENTHLKLDLKVKSMNFLKCVYRSSGELPLLVRLFVFVIFIDVDIFPNLSRQLCEWNIITDGKKGKKKSPEMK